MADKKRGHHKKDRAVGAVNPTSTASTMIFKPEDLLTDLEAAAVLRLKPHTLRVWRTTNRRPGLRFIRMGRSIRYMYADLLKFVEGCKNVAA